jgi:hypothetical protein
VRYDSVDADGADSFLIEELGRCFDQTGSCGRLIPPRRASPSFFHAHACAFSAEPAA